MRDPETMGPLVNKLFMMIVVAETSQKSFFFCISTDV